MAKTKGRSEQGRGNKDKGGKTAGKGFVAPRASREDKKAIGKGLAKMTAVAATTTPVGRAASLVGKAATKIASKKYAPKAGREIVRKITQTKKGNVTVQSPKSAGGGVSSPVKGSKITTIKNARTRSAKQQAASNEGRKVRQGTREAGRYVGGAIAGSIVTNEVNKRKGR